MGGKDGIKERGVRDPGRNPWRKDLWITSIQGGMRDIEKKKKDR